MLRGSHHDGMREVTIRLSLQAYSAQLGFNVAFRSRNVKSGPPDLAQFGRHIKRQHTLQAETQDTLSMQAVELV